MKAKIATRLLGALAIIAGLALQGAMASPKGIGISARYQGTDMVLLSGPGYTVTEQDMLAFGMIMDTVKPSDLYWWARGDQQFAPAIRESLELFAQGRLLAKKADPVLPAYEQDLRRRAVRIYSAPVAQWIWAGEVVSDKVRVYPEDVLHQFLHYSSDYMAPETITIRRLRVPVSPAMTLEDQNEARLRVNELREQAITAGGLGPILGANPELLVDPAGRAIEITPKDTLLETPVRDAVFSLGTRQISQPIRTPTGFYLVEIIDRREAEQVPLHTVLPEIKKGLFERFLEQQYAYLLGEKTAQAFPTNRHTYFQTIPEDADLVRVRKFSLTLGEFKHLFPEVVGNPRQPNLPAVAERAYKIITGEVATQELERARLLHGDPLYQRAEKMSENIYDAIIYVRQLREQLDPTEQEVAAYLEENREKLTPGPSLAVWKLELTVRNPERLSRGEQDSMVILMKSYMTEMITVGQRQLAERMFLAADPSVVEPDKVMATVPAPEDLRVKPLFAPVGFVDRATAPQQLPIAFEELELGKFTQPHALQDVAVVSYYVSAAVPGVEPAPGELMRLAREALITELASTEIVQEVKEMEERGELVYHPRLRPVLEDSMEDDQTVAP